MKPAPDLCRLLPSRFPSLCRRPFGDHDAITQVSWHQLVYLALFPLLSVGGWSARCRADEGPSNKVHGANANPNPIILLHRTVTQDQGSWVIDYELRSGHKTGVILAPSDLSATLEGWVSNSRIGSHTVPRWVRVSVSAASSGSATGEVIASTDESQQCRECVAIAIWPDDAGLPDEGTVSLASIAPGSRVHVRLRIEHQHVLFGNYDPLLGIQKIKLSLGSCILNDQVVLDSEQYLALPKHRWPEPPVDRRDTHHFVSPPDSVHLEAHIPGHQSYRYPDCPVRYGSKMRLRFWYLTAGGTEGECRVQLDQYRDTPTSWHPLTSSRFEQGLDVVGRWTKVEQVIRVDNEATTVALGFRIISETNIGEMWIDNVSFEPIGHSKNPADP